jgi:hypothetical protein
MVIVCIGSGCLQPFARRLDHISQQLQEANDMMRYATKQLEEGNQRAATLERAAKILIPALDKKEAPKQSSVDETRDPEVHPTAWNDKRPCHDSDVQASRPALLHRHEPATISVGPDLK